MYIGTQPAIGQNRKLDSIAASFNGVLTTFNLTVNTASIVPSNVYQLFISLGGVLQNPGVDFTASGNQITFTTAPTAGLSFFGIFQGDSITGTPTIADASITTLKLATGLTVTHTAGTAAVPSITFSGDLANGAFAPAANTFGITTGGTERLRIDSGGRLLAGTSTARNNFFGTTLSAVAQVEGTGGAAGRGALSVINNDVSNNPPYVLLGRSGAASLNSNAIVVNGSRLGTLTFHGADGTSFIEAATVAGEVDGTPGSTDMPGRLVFSTTADGAASPTERLRIDSSGRVGIGTASPSTTLAVAGGISGTAGANISGAGWGVLPYVANSLVIDNNAGETRFFATGANTTTKGSFIFYNGETDGGTTAAMVIDTSSRVGIGTTSPGSPLTIESNAGNQVKITYPSIASYYLNATSGGDFAINKDGTERARIDSSGRLLVGTSSAATTDNNANSPNIQLEGADGDASRLLIRSNAGTTATAGPIIYLSRSRGTTANSKTSVAADDLLGSFIFEGTDGTADRRAAGISTFVDGTPGANDMPGRLVFSTTADGASSPTERMRINQAGVAEFNKPGLLNTWLQVYNGNSSQDLAFVSSDNAGNEWHFGRKRSDGYFYVVRQTGTGMYMNTNSWVATSDQRAKQNIADIESTIDAVKALKPSRFNWKTDGTADVGFIAQQVQTLIPEAVVDSGKPEAMLGITQDKLLPFVVKALQEAIAKIETLEARLSAAGIE